MLDLVLFVSECESYHIKRSSCLLEKPHQARLTEILPSTNALLLWRQNVIGYC